MSKNFSDLFYFFQKKNKELIKLLNAYGLIPRRKIIS